MNRLVTSLICVVTLSVAFAAFSLWKSSKPMIVCVDIARIKGQFIEQLARHAASEETVSKASARFNKKLHRVLEDYATDTHVLIIDRPFILSGAVDVTQDIMSLLSKAMGEST